MRLLKDNFGMELLEAAITTPIAILVMVAIVNLGMLVYAQQAVQAAARQGARMGSVAQKCPACYAVSAARSAISSAGIVENASVNVLAPGGSAGRRARRDPAVVGADAGDRSTPRLIARKPLPRG